MHEYRKGSKSSRLSHFVACSLLPLHPDVGKEDEIEYMRIFTLLRLGSDRQNKRLATYSGDCDSYCKDLDAFEVSTRPHRSSLLKAVYRYIHYLFRCECHSCTLLVVVGAILRALIGKCFNHKTPIVTDCNP